MSNNTLKGLDPFYLFSPWIWGLKTDCITDDSTYIIRDSPYFNEFKAIQSNLDNYTDEDLRTMSYLARNYRDKVAYDPKNLDRYFQSIGLLPYGDRCFDMVCVNIDCPCDIDKDITYEDWKTLEDGRVPNVWKLEEKSSVQKRVYIESFDTPAIHIEKETPMK